MTGIVLPGDLCRDFARSSKLEWLETNRTGAYAMGTVAGVNTRRYHGLLVAALHPRRVLLARVEEETELDGQAFNLGAAQYPGVVTPRGFELLDEFRMEPCATWRYRLDGATLEKQVYLIEGRQAAVVRYRCDRALTLRVRTFLACRDYHSLGHARPDPCGDLPRLEFRHQGRFEAEVDWYRNNEYLVELDRGFDFREDLYSPGVIVLALAAGEWTPICASIDATDYAEPGRRGNPFVVKKAGSVPTIMAGYPWFTDWGRDTMISLPGLLIVPGDLETAREILEGFLAHLNQGLIPNRFPDAGETPEYNTADATLWMFQAMRVWLDAGGDRTFLSKTFYPAAREIIDWHRRGTFFGIGVDPSDHLLRAGTPDTQVTWMDARVDGWPVTPRNGKAVEINALWHGALCLMAEWSIDATLRKYFSDEAALVRQSFREKFWNPQRGCLYDVLADDGPVAKLRPNQIFAVSLPHGLLERDAQQQIVRVVERELLTTVGLRTLDRADPDYQGRYEGSPAARDGAYHQGTVWPWLMGAFIDAYLVAFGRTADTLAHCRGLVEALEAEAARGGCLGSIAEIFDGDEPRRPAGCPAQAWSVAEIARVKNFLDQ